MKHFYLRRTGFTFGVAFIALLGWANWQDPVLHSYAEPVNMAVFRVDGVRSAEQAVALERRIGAVPGVSACSIQPQTASAHVVFHPAEASVTAIAAAFARNGVAHATPLRLPAPPIATGPQCPVPAAYLVAFEQLRFTLNIRRFWIDA